ncbi:hypothetical protein ANCCAN_19598 [Ancylostoma caninum]|uniref:Uncharacterized protein n=1 Tax=Ancylostoma caninum TaxID=29170 RepID=A0A368FUR6_ANCCA|nr:hypothetical protein ANCCAN_19598 [Ancylostoma caninum]
MTDLTFGLDSAPLPLFEELAPWSFELPEPMEDDCHGQYYHQYGRYPYVTMPHHRAAYVIPRRHYDEEYSDYYRDYKTQSRDYDRRLKTYQQAIYYIRVLAYIQIFIAGVLLVSDVSRIVLLWTFVQSVGTIIEMVGEPPCKDPLTPDSSTLSDLPVVFPAVHFDTGFSFSDERTFAV